MFNMRHGDIRVLLLDRSWHYFGAKSDAERFESDYGLQNREKKEQFEDLQSAGRAGFAERW